MYQQHEAPPTATDVFAPFDDPAIDSCVVNAANDALFASVCLDAEVPLDVQASLADAELLS